MIRQRGYLLLIAAFLIVVGSFTVITITNVITNSASSIARDLDTTQAFYVANAGLSRAKYLLSTSDVSSRISCSTVTGNANLTTVTLGEGQFTVTGTAVTTTSSTLSSGISSSSSIIPISNLSNYTNAGRITIDSEVIDYTGTSSSSGACSGNAPCLLGITRGTANTIAASHSSGATIIQSRCALTSTGAVPILASPTGKRIVSGDVFLTSGVTGGAWFVGNKRSGNESIYQLNGGSWSQYGPSAGISNVDLYGIYMINSVDGWIVGKKSGGEGTIVHWNGSSWTEVSPSASTPNKNLRSVYCVTSNDCWAVGDNETFIHWNGSTWTNGSKDNSVPNKRFYSVTCTASNNCYAVGQKHNSDVLIVNWNGSTWSRVTGSCDDDGDDDDDDDGCSLLSLNKDLYGITCTSSSDCWAVGKDETFIHYNGSTWSEGNKSSNIPNKKFSAISCLNSNDCWAVGDKQGGSAMIAYWNGSIWSRVTPDISVPNQQLYAVTCANTNECWAGGKSGTLIYWNGTSWLDANDPNVPNLKINGIDMTGGYTNSIVKNWAEV